jgi:DNA-binding SARP family transcriptional activator
VIFGLLGPVEVRPFASTPPLELGSPLQRVLLGLLLSEADRSVSFDRIVEELWGNAPPSDPEASLHTYVSRLRRALEPERATGDPPRLLLRTPTGYRLAVSPDAVDAGRFIALAATARGRLAAGDAGEALTAADAALALWRGTVLEDARDREFAVRLRDRLEEQRLACREDRLAALLALGWPGEVVADAEALVAEHPLRERLWVLLIDALHAAGRTADALARYTDVHRLLDEELGVAPGPALRAAQARALESGEASIPSPRSAPDDGRPPLIGRERELGRLRELVAGLPRTGPRFVLLDGEPGIGKSRLAAELTAVAEEDGARVAWGRCHEDDDSPALWPWHQIVSALGGELPTGAPDEGAFAAFERVLTALVSATAHGPVIVVVDDLHWADPASLRLLAFLAVELQHGPVAVVCTCRTDVRDPGLAQVRATLARTADFTSLALGPLDAADTARLLRRVTGSLDDRTAADLHARSGGNPFFVTELARVAVPDEAVPPGVRDVVDRRLARLPESARSVLQLAAAAGQRFDVGLLQRASGTDDEELLDALDAAQAADLVRPAGPGRLAFAHALVRDSLVAEVPELRRSRLHARLASALPVSADPFERAHHLVAGRPFTDLEETVTACAAAASRAALDHAHETTARWWERALEALDADPSGSSPALRQDLLLRAGTSMARAGSWAAAQRLLGDAIDSALARGDVASAGVAAEQLSTVGGIWFPVEYETYPQRLVERLESVIAAAGADDAARVRALTALSMYCHYGPDRSRGLREAARALAVARRSRRADLLVTALHGQLAATWLPGHEEELIDAATEVLGLIDERTQPEMAAIALARRGVGRLVLGDVDGNDADLSRAWEVAEQHALPLISSQLISFRAARAMLEGSYEVALDLIDRAWAITQRTQLYGQNRTDLVMRAFVWIDQGCLPEKLATLGSHAMTNPTSGTLLITALALLQAGQPAAAAAVMAGDDGFARYPLQWDTLSITCWQALIAADLAAEPSVPLDPTVPAAIAERLLPYAGQLAIHGGIGALGPVGVFLGMAEVAAGRLDAAEAHLRSAVATSERLGFRPARARGRLALAGVLAARGDRSAAAAEAAAAREIAEQVGMRGLARRAAGLAHV